MKICLLLFVGILLTLFTSCSHQTEEVVLDPSLQKEENQKNKHYNLDTLRGIYVGDFGGSDIRIVLNYLNDTRAVGYNIHKGLQRNLLGTVKILENEVTLILEEPGDNQYDGVFTVSIDKRSFKMTGFWESNTGQISKKTFKLSKQRITQAENIDWGTVEFTVNNFTDYFSTVGDSLGSINFYENGMAMYEYYPSDYANQSKSQLVQVKGSWTVRGNEVTILWQENSVFPNRKSVLTIVRNEDYLEGLQLEDRMLYNYMF
jgi:hypothetical protein